MSSVADSHPGTLSGQVPPTWAQLSPADLLERREAAARLVEDDGVVVGTDRWGRARHLRIDPMPLVVPAEQWTGLERGLAQRAELLDLVLADLYGERTLLASGVVPAELVLGHPRFIPAADGIATRHGLFFTAADLGRGADGSWRVVADRAQSPVGAGYAMAVRRVTARALASVHRETDLRRLRDFFDLMRTGLQEMGAGTSELPRVVMLTSPDAGESEFDDVFTASLLGFPVVHADDLAMRGGRVWLRTTDRLEPVDVVVRRLDAAGLDPLDLALGRKGGVPGLIEATRRGVVTVVNPVGAGVLENPALAAYLPAAAAALLGEELLLESVPTWWCGEERALGHVRDHLDDLVLAPLSPTVAEPRVFPAQLAAEQRAELWARVEAEPWAWCAQEVLPPWTAPVVGEDGPTPRAGLLRTFTLAGPHASMVMPGGLARLAADADDTRIPALGEALVKDVWVLSGDAATSENDQLAVDVAGASASGDAAGEADPARPAWAQAVPLSPSAAEDLYWFGRYTERAEATARLLLVADNLVEDHLGRPRSIGYAAMRVLIDAVDAVTAVHRDRSRADAAFGVDGESDSGAALPADPVPHLRTLVLDGDRRGTLAYCARRAARAATGVRELLSLDTWLVLGRLERTVEARAAKGASVQTVAGSALESLLALAGIGAEGLVRDASWACYDAGRRVERAQATVRLLRHTMATPRSPRVDRLVLEAVLTSQESLISHRRRAAQAGAAQSRLAIALDLVLLDPSNPRSVAFGLRRIGEDLASLPSGALENALAGASATLAATDIELFARDRARLAEHLRDLEAALRALSATFDATVFRHRGRAHVVEGPR